MCRLCVATFFIMGLALANAADIGDYVWEDADGDGIQDSAESGAAGVAVALYDCNAGRTIANTTADAGGRYAFTGLAAGRYRIQFVAPAGYRFSPHEQGSNRGADSNADPTTGFTLCRLLADDQSRPGIDAGLVPADTGTGTAEIGDYVWEDADGDGIQDSTESGTAGISVLLHRCASGDIVRNTTTDSAGRYLFDRLAAGSYRVQFVLPTGFRFSPFEQGTSRGLDSNADPETGFTACQTLVNAQSRPGIDAGLVPPTGTGTGMIGDYVWEDVDDDGIQDSAESGVAGVAVSLYDCNAGRIAANTTTDAGGRYVFDRLAAGFYRIQFAQPAGFKFSPFGRGTSRGLDSNADPATGYTNCQTLANAQSRPGIDAGLVPTGTSTGMIGDYVWEDVDGDGIQDSAESGVAGVAVSLYDCNAGRIVASTATDTGGRYAFERLAPGFYRIQFARPAGFEFSPFGRGTSRGLDSNADPSSGYTNCQTLANAQSRPGIDAGLVPVDSGGAGLNVLLISIDDLRPEIGAYGVNAIRTPGIDALARDGITFTRAYAQMATCSPSRNSFLSGLRPDTTGITTNKIHLRERIPNVVTLPEYFKRKGYHSEGICKVYHDGKDDAQSWSVPHRNAWGPGAPIGPDGKRLPFAAVNVDESRFGDHRCATLAINAIQSSKDRPFFIAVGFRKPHLPFLAPPAYFNMYNKNAIPMAPNPFRATGAPAVAFENWGELRQYSGIPAAGQTFSEGLRRDLKHGYYASTSFVDDQVRRVLTALDTAGLRQNTVVVLLGDHGFHLGEQNDWAKHMTFDVSTQVPLIIRTPGTGAGTRSDALVELVDLYPTIVELAGLPIPNAEQHGGLPLEGDSLTGIVENPAAESRRGAFSQWTRDGYVGHSIRTSSYRYTEWVRGSNRFYELYDHAIDPNETINVVNNPEYAAVLPLLRQALAAGGKTDLPPELR
jgi:arylsulfatase A-like enzyme/protocatechuate 3,4-dioxygenase beta subunit